MPPVIRPFGFKIEVIEKAVKIHPIATMIISKNSLFQSAFSIVSPDTLSVILQAKLVLQ
jgi:hypothetical protein